jgi:hypothetical protein
MPLRKRVTKTPITVRLSNDGKVSTNWPWLQTETYQPAVKIFKELIKKNCKKCENKENRWCNIDVTTTSSAWWSPMLLEWLTLKKIDTVKLEFRQIWDEGSDLYLAQLIQEDTDNKDKVKSLLCRVASGKASNRFPGPACISYIYLIDKYYDRSKVGNPKYIKKWKGWFQRHTLRITVSLNDQSHNNRGQDGGTGHVLTIQEEELKLEDTILENNIEKIIIPPVLRDSEKKEKPVRCLVSSPRVTEVVARMNEVWSGIAPSAVVLTSPPGSGKEVMMNLLARGLCPKNPKKTTTLIGQKEGVDRILFGHADNDYYYPGLVWQARHGDSEHRIKIKDVESYNNTEPESHGLRKAIWGVVFVDEIHQASETGRSILLRLLENKSYRPPGLHVDLKADGVVFFFASSMPQAELVKRPPSDFWTRISSFLHMPNPLDVSPGDKREKVIGSYFHFFWNKAWEDASKISNKTSEGPVKAVLNRIIEDAETLPALTVSGERIQEQVSKYLRDVPESILCVRHMRILSFDLFGEAIRYIGTHCTGNEEEDERLLEEWWNEHGGALLHRRSWELLAGGK